MSNSDLMLILIFSPMIFGIFGSALINKNILDKFFLSFSYFVLILSSYLYYQFSYQGYEPISVLNNWISIGETKVEFYFKLDGLNAPLVLLGGILTVVAVHASRSIKERKREYYLWMFLLISGVFGVFLSFDLILFFFFFELEIIPLFFLISIWGSGRKEYSAMKFLLFTLSGSAMMIVGFLCLYFSSAGTGTFNIDTLSSTDFEWIIPSTFVFILIFVGFSIKLPMFPLHGWLPDAHTDAPTAASVLLAGLLLKMGGYGILRICYFIMPNEAVELSGIISVFGAVSVIYGALLTLKQTDLKRIVAFSSVSHMGYILIGISAFASNDMTFKKLGLSGASFQMVSHGLITGLLFYLVGIIYEKCKTREVSSLGGLATQFKFTSIALAISGMASLGLPGTSGFVSELMIFMGGFQNFSITTSVSVFGVVLAAGYILWMLQRVIYGELNPKYSKLNDMNFVEKIPVVILIVSIIFLGIYPKFIIDVLNIGIAGIIN